MENLFITLNEDPLTFTSFALSPLAPKNCTTCDEGVNNDDGKLDDYNNNINATDINNVFSYCHEDKQFSISLKSSGSSYDLNKLNDSNMHIGRNPVRSKDIRKTNWILNFIIILVIGLFVFAIWSHFKTNRQQFYCKFNYRSLTYYSVEELIQPYVRLVWHQPPPI